MRKQFIYIGMKECIAAVRDKDRLEALAFALMVKLTFVDSVIKSVTIRQLARIFRLGNKRLGRVLKNALRYFYIVKEGNTYYVPSLKQRGSFNKRLEYDFATFSTTEDGRSAYKLNRLMKDIRKAVWKNHLRKQQAFLDTASVVNAPSDDKEYKRHLARLKRMCGITTVSKKQLKDSSRLSIKKSMKVMGAKRSMTKTLINEMVANGEVERHYRNIAVSMFYKDLEDKYKLQQLIYQANELTGFIYIYRGAVYLRVANSYSLSERENNSISYSPNLKCTL